MNWNSSARGLWGRRGGVRGRINLVASVLFAFLAGLALALPSRAANGPEDFRLLPETRIKISVVEWVVAQGEYREWTALTGEYGVSVSGTVSVPLIGEIEAAGLVPGDLAQAIGTALQRRTGLQEVPAVTVQIVRYPPVFVTGNVDRPGMIEYSPGLTILKAVSLAGGRERRTGIADRYSDVDQIRYAGDLQRTNYQIKQQMARRARLQAEFRDQDRIVFPSEFEQAAPGSVLGLLRETEKIQFRTRIDALARQMASLSDLGTLLRKEIDVLDEKLGTQDEQIRIAREELEDITRLVSQKTVVRSRQTSLERVVADLQSNRLDMVIASTRAKQKLSETERDAVHLKGQRKIEVSASLQDAESQLEDLRIRRLTTLQLMQANGMQMADDSALDLLEYRIVSAPGAEPVLASAGTLLSPGDVVQVRFKPVVEDEGNRIAAAVQN